jgi:hypothetical protein
MSRRPGNASRWASTSTPLRIYWILKQAGLSEADKFAPMLNATFGRFPNHAHNATELRQLKAEIYKVLLPAVGTERMVELAERIFRLERK